MSVEGEVRRFRKDLKKAKAQDAERIADQLPSFSCAKCARCCRGAFGDNTVTVFPGEVRGIMAATGIGWLDVAEPEEAGDEDRYGNRHAFEWALRKRPDGDCIFLEDGRCAIYDVRPFICRTYPFYLEDGRIGHGECDGLGGEERTEGPASKAMARDLIDRSVRELEESIALLERLDMEAGRGHTGLIVAHDSEGARLVSDDGGRRRFCGGNRRQR